MGAREVEMRSLVFSRVSVYSLSLHPSCVSKLSRPLCPRATTAVVVVVVVIAAVVVDC